MPDVADLAKSALQEVKPSSEIREGTPMHDVFVKAGQILFQKYEEQFHELREMLFLRNFDIMDRDEMDAHSSNYFVERSNGRPSVGVARLLFSRARSFFLPAGETFIGEEETNFVSQGDVELTQNEMNAQMDGDLFYADVPIESSVDGEGNGEAIETMQNSPTGLARIETIDVPSGGVKSESNRELHQKIEKKIGTRDLVQEPSIEAQLVDEFDFITEVQTIGFQDEEMERDTVPFLGDQYHIGMHTDIYLKFLQLKQTIDIIDLGAESTLVTEFDEDSRYWSIDIENKVNDGAISLREVCVVNSGGDTSEIINGNGGSGSTGTTQVAIGGACQYEFDIGGGVGTESVSMRSLNPELTFSARANPRLIIPKGKIDNNGNLVTDNNGNIEGPLGTPNRQKVLAVNYFYTPDLKIVQDFLDSGENRNVVADLLARHLVPSFVDVFMEYKGDARESSIEAEFHEMIYKGEFIEISDLVNAAYELGANSVRMDTLDVTLEVHNNKGEVIVNDQPIEDKLTFDHPDVPPERIRTLLPRQIVVQKIG